MKWLQTYKIHLLMVTFALAFLSTYTLYVGRELEIQQLKRDNEALRDYVKTLNQKIELLDSYNYEHSEIK